MSQFTENISASVASENDTLELEFPNSPQLDMDFLSSTKVTVILKCAIRMLDCICGTLGNVLMLTAIKRTPRLWTKSNMLIAALAASDLFISGPQTIYFVTSQLVAYVFSDRPCDYRTMLAIAIPIQEIPYCTSHSLLVGIAIDRYVAIVYPLHYETKLTEARVKLIVACSYVLGILVGIVHALWLIDMDWSSCDFPYSVALQFAMDFSMYVLVASVFVVVYGRVFLIAVHHRKEIALFHKPGAVGHVREKQSAGTGTGIIDQEETGRRFKRKEFKAARMTGILICSFVLSWLPFHVGRGLQVSDNREQYTKNLLDIGSALGSTNVALQWIYYGIMSSDFKQAFLKILRYKGNLVANIWQHGPIEIPRRGVGCLMFSIEMS